MQESKKGTGRVVVWREFRINFSFTIEASFSGMSIGPYKDTHLTIHHLENMGKHLCQTLADFAQNPLLESSVSTEGFKTTPLPHVVRKKGVKSNSAGNVITSSNKPKLSNSGGSNSGSSGNGVKKGKKKA